MKLCVCGLGKVGRPLLEALRTRHDVMGYDIDPEKSQASLSSAVEYSEAALFIVPTPSLPNGSFSNEYLIAALDSFKREADRQNRDYLYIVVSTTVPGSCESFRAIVGGNICYKPEFIRLAHVERDLITPSFILIGSPTVELGDKCAQIYSGWLDVPIKRMSLTEAELAKISLNCALTMKISLANQVHLLAQRMGLDSGRIMDAVGTDRRIGGEYLTPGFPYGGPCLPRDNRMFQYIASKYGVDACLSKAADSINETVGMLG